ncbi:hypothetical protein KOW79_018475 [Hemibagrus wyckioides]|uniref:Uncharacterized protein n=1 Tax=Hemibagrus wyckioides TaxID=337641 RepID=A0A9D3NCW4_9TELE|nr:hypothetical protein KOW79_018475 [Hemibagrus wyckioides]
MQFCSLHHCVLVFLILTFTTAPVSALEVCPTRGKLHQSVTLSCKHQCSGLLKWSLLSNRDDVLAECDRTSCRSKEGFSISHDQYLRGDSSLTITAADYSQRNVYACECGDIDYAFVRLIIETVFSQVQLKFGEDLKLHVSVPEPVEVIYKSSGSADEVICRVNNLSLQCKDKYRDRTSLTYPELTLRHMEPRDSGRYTIRDTKNEEDIQIYAVSVEDKQHAVPVWVIILLILIILLSCCVGVGIYLKRRHHLRILFKRRQQLVEQLVHQAEGWTEENIIEVEKSLSQLKQQYINTGYSEEVKLFCMKMRKQLLPMCLLHVVQLVKQAEDGEKDIRQMEKEQFCLNVLCRDTDYSVNFSRFCSLKKVQLNSQLLRVHQLVQQAKGGSEAISEVEKKINLLEQQYINTVYYDQVSVLCDVKRKELKGVLEDVIEPCITTWNKTQILQVKQRVHEAIQVGRGEKISEVEEEINQLELQHMTSEDFSVVSWFCMVMRAELFWYRLLNSDKEQLMTEKIEILCKVEELTDALEKVRVGGEREQKIPSSTEVYKMKKDLMEIKKWCEKTEGKINYIQHRDGAV